MGVTAEIGAAAPSPCVHLLPVADGTPNV